MIVMSFNIQVMGNTSKKLGLKRLVEAHNQEIVLFRNLWLKAPDSKVSGELGKRFVTLIYKININDYI